MNPQFPLYIPSKGRYEYMMTSKVLTSMGCPHYIIVESQEFKLYQESVDKMGLLTTVLELDMSFKSKYELCDNFGLTKSTGSGPARNFGWEHSISQGHKWHWMMDDNIKTFRRLNNNQKIIISDGSGFRVMEDFTLRYENVGMAGPHYFSFVPKKQKFAPFQINTRVYSCNLIRNDLGYRWRGRYNEDTILSLDILKVGWCTILFYAFLQEKMPTQTMKGGNTEELYKNEKLGVYSKTGTIDKSQMLVNQHPDVARIAYRFNRVHHHVDFRYFKKLGLIKKKNLEISSEVNNYGMKLKTISD